jgi:hypothetical protein
MSYSTQSDGYGMAPSSQAKPSSSNLFTHWASDDRPPTLALYVSEGHATHSSRPEYPALQRQGMSIPLAAELSMHTQSLREVLAGAEVRPGGHKEHLALGCTYSKRDVVWSLYLPGVQAVHGALPMEFL